MLSDDSDVEDLNTLTINEHYAKAFEYRKEREELAKLKDKYGSDLDEDEDEEEDSEDAESEDEDGEELTPAMDAAILRTLARIKRKDPAIYESGKDVFEEERKKTGELSLSRTQKDKSKPLTMRQHALASALEDPTGSRSPSPEPLTHVQEQSQLRAETIAAFHTAVGKGQDGGEDEEEDDLLVLREKTKDEIEKEEEEYRAYLQREVGEDLSGLITVEAGGDEGLSGGGVGAADAQEESKKKSKSKSKKEKKAESGQSKQDDDQEFLMNYILGRGWIDRSSRRLPTYQEVTSKKGKGKTVSGSDAEDDHDTSGSDGERNYENSGSVDEDEFDEIADRFESSYNFRFEEPGAAEIARHPRNLPSLVRREDTTRKEAREKRKARKEEELLKKKEEVKRLKALKMKEVRAKLERIGHEGGKNLEESEALQALDLDADWDPEAHDRQMAELYANDAGEEDFVDDEKPNWDDDIDITDIVPADEDSDAAGPSKKKKKKKKKKGEEEAMDEGAVDIDDMDADVERAFDEDEVWDGTEEMRRRKVEEYMDEVYGLDFNDMTAGMPTRFKYTKVDSQTFGLAPSEILMATDAELNEFMGIKKYAPYRKEGKGRNWDAQRATRLRELKAKLQERGVDGGAGRKGGAEGGEKGKKRKGKKERMREKAAAAEAGGAAEDGEDGAKEDGGGEVDLEEVPQDRPKEKKRKRAEVAEDEEDEGEHREAGDATTKKKRRRHRKSAAVATAS